MDPVPAGGAGPLLQQAGRHRQGLQHRAEGPQEAEPGQQLPHRDPEV